MVRIRGVSSAAAIALTACVTFASCDQSGTSRPAAPTLDSERLSPVWTRVEGSHPKSRGIVSLPGQSSAIIDPQMARANNRFGFKMFAELAAEDPDSNLFISPSSIALALMMTYNGAAGETRRAMEHALELSGLTREEINDAALALIRVLESGDPKGELAIANSLWADDAYDFKTDFLERCRAFYDAEVRSMDLQAEGVPARINGWVSEKTRETITHVINPPIKPNTILFLINAIYFKGTWTYEFNPDSTQDGDFFGTDGANTTLPFMEQMNKFDYLDGDGFAAVRLPYGSERFSMCLFLPDEDVGLSAFQATLSDTRWEQWQAGFGRREGTVQLPRFKLEFSRKLNDALRTLGMGIAFSDRADFADMIDTTVLISSVLHKSFLKVNEEGTEASAVTVVEIGITDTSEGPQPIHLRFDRPFFCTILDDHSGAILFMGAVYNPEALE